MSFIFEYLKSNSLSANNTINPEGLYVLKIFFFNFFDGVCVTQGEGVFACKHSCPRRSEALDPLNQTTESFVSPLILVLDSNLDSPKE